MATTATPCWTYAAPTHIGGYSAGYSKIHGPAVKLPTAIRKPCFGIQVSSASAVAKTNQYYEAWSDFESCSLAEEKIAHKIRETFLQAIHTAFPGRRKSDLKILDCGCGIGRDLAAFGDLGYDCQGFDPCPRLVAKARSRSGQQVHTANLGSINLPTRFHGAFCLASLYHVPRVRLAAALLKLSEHLVKDGVLLVTMPPGQQDLLHPDGCWVNNMPAEELTEFLTAAGFHVVASPTSVDIFGYESTLLVARNWGVIQPGRLPSGPSSGPSTNSAYVKESAKAYAASVPAFSDMAERQSTAKHARDLFLQAVHDSFPHFAPSSLRLLDAGCGSGRDLASFRRMGCACEGFDPCQSFVQAASETSACAVHLCHFENLNLPRKFHGIFCMASLYHVPRSRLVPCLQNLSRHLLKDGILLLTIPRGPPYLDRPEPDGRWLNFMAPEEVIARVNSVTDLALVHLEEDFKIYSGKWILGIAKKR